MADWDADDFEPDTASASVAARPSDKWDGEDEDDDIKVRLISIIVFKIKLFCFTRTPGMLSRRKKTLRNQRRPSQ